MANATIGLRYLSCLGIFNQLCQNIERSSTTGDETISLPAIQHELGKLQIWAGDIGAQGTGRASLEHRLLESNDLYEAIVELLDELWDQLSKFSDICSRQRMPLHLISPDSDGTSQESTSGPKTRRTEPEQLFCAVEDIIRLLFELSIELHDQSLVISKPREMTFSVQNATPADLQFVVMNFPNAEFDLCERFAKAITARRIIFDPRKINFELQGSVSDDAFTDDFSAWSHESGNLSSFGILEELIGDISQVRHFVCSFCSLNIKVADEKAWRSHLVKHLEPYMCTFRGCIRGDKPFSTRQEWFDHEARIHRSAWFCNACQESHVSRVDFMDHLRLKHSEISSPPQLDGLAEMCVRPMDRNALGQCPFCEKLGRRISSHVANHMSALIIKGLGRSQNHRSLALEEREGRNIGGGGARSSSSTRSGLSPNRSVDSKDGTARKSETRNVIQPHYKIGTEDHRTLKTANDLFRLGKQISGADRETLVQSLPRKFEYDYTKDYKKHILGDLADTISQMQPETRLQVIEADRDREDRSSISMKMLKLLKFDDDFTVDDTKFCNNEYHVMDQATKGRIWWIISSKVVRQWLASATSSGLLVNGNSDAMMTRSPLSLLCAKAVALIGSNDRNIVLSYFCGLHTNVTHPRDNAAGMLNCLLGQLIAQVERMGFDMGFADLEHEDLRGAKKDHLPSLLKIFRDCVHRIPYTYTIYCIIDGISFYETSQRKNDTCMAVRKLCRMVSTASTAAFKLLVTAPGRTLFVHKYFASDEILNVPSNITSNARGSLERAFSDLTGASAATSRKTQDRSHVGQREQQHKWWDRNEPRAPLVSVEG